MNTVIFDIGGVVIPWLPQRAFEQVMPAEQVPAFMERIGFDEWNRANDRVRSLVEPEEELVRRFPADEVGIRGYRQHFPLTITTMVPGTSAIIAELQQAGVTVSALTNWAADPFLVAQQRFGILGRFQDIVISGIEGVVKPEPEIYLLACQRLGISPGEAVFVDDTAANAQAATAVGMTGLHFTSADRLRAELVGLGLLGPRVAIEQPVYHWALRSEWQDAQRDGRYLRSSRELGYHAAGFVHACFADQAAEVRQTFYGDLADDELVLLRLEPDAGLPIVVEDGYPHLFAPVPLDATVVDPTLIAR